MTFKTSLREGLATITRRLPVVRGLGRLVLLADRALTNPQRTDEVSAQADLNSACRLNLDLRSREQKFAFYYGRWEPELIGAVQRHYRDGVFYDIGASIGLYATTFGRIARSRGQWLRAFEPVPSNRERLLSQLPLNHLTTEHVRLEPIALGDAEGSVQLTLVDDGRPGNAKIVSHGEFEVPVSTLDLVWERCEQERVGFIKIDTEGWDPLILNGGRRLIAACRPNLLVEFNRERMRNLGFSIDPCWQFLVDELKYRCFRVDESGREHALTTPGIWENLLFVTDNHGGSTAVEAHVAH